MRKKSELFFGGLQVPVDFLMLVLAAITAYTIRDIPQILALKPLLYNYPFEDYIRVVFIVIPLFILVYALEGLYDMRSTRRFWREVINVFKATSIGLFIIIVAIFLKREWFSSRFIILAAWGFGIVYVSLARYILQKIQRIFLSRRGYGMHRMLLIGANERMDRVRKFIKANRHLGYRVVDHIDTASVRRVKEIRSAKGVDEIIVGDPTISDQELAKLLDYSMINNIIYKYIPTSLQTLRFRSGIFAGEPVLEVEYTPLDGWGKILKRAFDIVGSGALLLLLSPVFFVIAMVIKLQDRGPVFYQNKRVRNDGQTFFAYKFRYMKWEYCIHKDNPDMEKAIAFEKELIKKYNTRKGALYKIKDDPRKTTIGSFIEKYSFDELPQLWNVFKGEMSLVGPRPHQEREVAKYREYHRRLLTIKPGLTGMAQVSGRSDLDFEDEYKLDVFYIEQWSLWLDVLILLKTVRVIFSR